MLVLTRHIALRLSWYRFSRHEDWRFQMKNVLISPNNDFKNKLTGIFNLFPEIDLRAMGFDSPIFPNIVMR
ncbi:MAG: hypothetical protein IJZ70_03715 [Bacteroidales bacterium]|nr:hypothetical protein [Bacteroidales bacterium]